MLQRALMPAGPVTNAGEVTYGDLLDRTRSSVAAAILIPDDRLTTLDEARQELLGYLRFVRLGGEHIDLMARLAGSEADELRAFGRHLANAVHRDAGPSTWYSAAAVLGAAHDLVTSQLDMGLKATTPDAQALLTQTRTLSAARHTVQLLSMAATARDALTRRIAAVERGQSADGDSSSELILAARRAERQIHIEGRAAMRDLRRLGIDDDSSGLESLGLPEIRSRTTHGSFESTLTALRSLRQLSFDQAHGRAPASPASLRDLARLGELANHPDTDWLPPVASGLARVQQANIVDALTTAHDQWALAGRHLTTTVQGTTKAPRRYAESVRWLHEAVQRQPSARLAVISSLPALADEASGTLLDLAGRGSLVTRQRAPMHLHSTWARIPFADAQALIVVFDTAGNSSRLVAHHLRCLTDSADQRRIPPASVRTASHSIVREFSR